MNKHYIPEEEFKYIFRWADFARTNEEFWSRVLLACAVYSPEAQMKVAKLVAFCMNTPETEAEQARIGPEG